MRVKNFKEFVRKMLREKSYKNETINEVLRGLQNVPPTIHNWGGLKSFMKYPAPDLSHHVAKDLMGDYIKLVNSYSRPKPKKKKHVFDGLNEKDCERIGKALRNVWAWSHSRKLCIERAVNSDGFPVCELCASQVPKVYIDHIEPVGTVDAKIIERLFVPSTKMQALCKKCHGEKTKRDNKKIKDAKDFY